MKFKSLLFSLSCLAIGFAPEATAQYCFPDYFFGCQLGDDINTFTVTGVNSTSINTVNSGCALSGDYEDFTSDSVSFNQGGTYTASINSEASNDFVEVYIDFDNSGAFSSSESVGGFNNLAVDPALSTFSIVIPGGAAPGPHRMRVVSSGDSTYPGINPCPWNQGLSGYGGGEVHDYVAVILGTACGAPTSVAASSITFDGATFNWAAVTGATGYQYALNTSPTPPTSGTPTTLTTYTGSGLMSGTVYYFHVRTACGNQFSAWTTITFTTAICPAPAGLAQSGVTASAATVSWTAVAGAQGYQYAVNTSMTPPSTGTYTTSNSALVTGLSASTTYHTWVRTVCGQGDTSGWNPMHMWTTLSGVNVVNVASSSFSLEAYPNPVKHSLHIIVAGSIQGTASIYLTDITGKVINTYILNGTEMSIDMSSLSAGIYFIRYADNEHRQTIKINKE